MIIEYTDEYNEKLIHFYRQLQRNIPFWMNLSNDSIYQSLFNDVDKFGKNKFNELKTYIYLDDFRNIKGFIQFGEPAYIFKDGKQIYDSNTGVIRQVYCCESIYNICDNLLDIAFKWFSKIGKKEIYSFYHALGMSCAFSNGKLPGTFEHITTSLYNKGFVIEHENYVYKLELALCNNNDLILEVDKKNNLHILSLLNDNDILGKCEIQKIFEQPTAYLNWIYIDSKEVNKGYGTLFMNKINNYLLGLGFKYLLCDTSNTNYIAQKYYIKNGFEFVSKVYSFILDN